MIREKTAAIVRTVFMVKKRIAATLGTAAVIETATITKTALIVRIAVLVTRILKFFKKKAIIALRKKTVTVPTRTFRKGIAISFNKREKYIWINANNLIFA